MFHLSMGLGNMEVLIRLITVVKNQNCQAYLCVFFVFSILSDVLSILHFKFVSFRSVRITL